MWYQISNVFILFQVGDNMTEVQIIPFISWAIVSAVLFAVVAIVYKTYLKKKKSNQSA
jgi:hypothetical protein